MSRDAESAGLRERTKVSGGQMSAGDRNVGGGTTEREGGSRLEERQRRRRQTAGSEVEGSGKRRPTRVVGSAASGTQKASEGSLSRSGVGELELAEHLLPPRLTFRPSWDSRPPPPGT
jgi:hypothetical protein